MSIKGLLIEKLQETFGRYVSGISPENLTVELLNGVIRQENLELRREALDGLKLPITVLSGRVGSLLVKVPWAHLSTQPVEVEIDTVELLAATNYELESEEAGSLAGRVKGAIADKLRRVHDADLDRQTAEVFGDTYMQRLGLKIVENMHVSVTNLHLRFEDEERGCGKAVAAGVCMSELSIRTTDAEGNAASAHAEEGARHKQLKMDGLEVYWRYPPPETLLLHKIRAGVDVHDAFVSLGKEWEAEEQAALNSLDTPSVLVLDGSDDPVPVSLRAAAARIFEGDLGPATALQVCASVNDGEPVSMRLEDLLDMDEVGAEAMQSPPGRPARKSSSSFSLLNQAGAAREAVVQEVAESMLERLREDQEAREALLTLYHRQARGCLLSRASLQVQVTVDKAPQPKFSVTGDFDALHLRIERRQLNDIFRLSQEFVELEEHCAALRAYSRIDGAGALCFLPSAADGRTPRSPAPAEGLCEEQVAEFEEAFRLLGDAPTGKDVPFSEGELARERGGQAALRAVLQSLALEERL